jgi:hypothetical protein
MLASPRSWNIFRGCQAERGSEFFRAVGKQDMGTIKLVLGIIAIVFVVYGGFQFAPVEMNNYSFQDDLRNIAMMAGGNPHQTDQDILDSVIRKAREHSITLAPEQVTVQRIGTPGAPAVYVGADYSVPISLPGYSFTMHFTPSSGNKGM